MERAYVDRASPRLASLQTKPLVLLAACFALVVVALEVATFAGLGHGAVLDVGGAGFAVALAAGVLATRRMVGRPIRAVSAAMTAVCGAGYVRLDPARGIDGRWFAELLASPRSGRMMGNRPEMQGLRANGEELLAEFSIAHFRVGGEALVAAIVRDIPVRRARGRELVEARQKAELASEAKSRFLAQMSHEIRTPLNGMLGMAEVMEGIVTDPAQREMLRMIQASGQSLLDILNDVLDLSKIASGKLALDAAPFQPMRLASRLQAGIGVTADAKAWVSPSSPPSAATTGGSCRSATTS